MDYEQNYDLVDKQVVAPSNMLPALAQTAKAVATEKNIELPPEISALAGEPSGQTVAAALVEAAEQGLIVIGANAMQHPQSSMIKAVAQWIAEQTSSKLAVLAPANSAAAWLGGCIPHRGANGDAVEEDGMNAAEMLEDGLRGFVLLGAEPELDAINAQSATQAMQQAEFVVQISAFKSDAAMEYADVLLPMTAFTESAGTFVNCEGRDSTVSGSH